MSTYTDRTGQEFGSWIVLADIGRTKRGQVLWLTRNREDGREKGFTTAKIIKLDREFSARDAANRAVLAPA